MPSKVSTSFILTTDERASFAVTSRLLSCIVTESLLRGVFVPFVNPSCPSPDTKPVAVGLCLVLYSDLGDGEENLKDRISGDSQIFCAIPLRRKPIFKRAEDVKRHSEVGYLDPLDMLPCVFETQDTLSGVLRKKDLWSKAISTFINESRLPASALNRLTMTVEPLHFWKKLTDALGTDDELRDSIGAELQSSEQWQRYVYHNPPPYLTLKSSSIEWEQSLIEGHPTHPMHRARRTLPPIPWINPGEYDYFKPNIRLVSVLRSKMQLHPSFESLMQPFYDAAERNAGRPISSRDDSSRVLVPTHELQVVNLLNKFEDVEALDEEFCVPALAQSSIRSVVLPAVFPNLSLKLPIGVKITSALRTVSHWTADFGPRFSEQVVPKLAINPDILILEKEVAGMTYIDADPEKQKHFTALLREAYENTSEKFGERVIVCAALVEMDANGVPAVQAVLKLNSRRKRLDYLDRYVRLLFEGLLPPMLINGVAFEAHPQNMLARFDIKTGELNGFVVRDLGGLRIHGPTLNASIGEDFTFLPGHCIPTATLQDAFKKLYHTLFHNHLQRLIRVLDLHYDGSGWEIVRKHLDALIPVGHPLRKAWLEPGSEFISGKCLLRMKLEGVYRDNVYHSMPNMIHCKPSL